MARENARLGNHAPKKGQKSGGLSKYKAKKPNKPPKTATKKLYIYQSKDDGLLTVWHGKFSSKMMLQYWTLVYEITVDRVGGKPGDIIRRIAAGIEFGNETVRFDPL